LQYNIEMSFEGYNLKLKKKEKMLDVMLVEIEGKGGKPRFFIKGKGSDGTVMYKVIKKEDYDKYKTQGYKAVKQAKKAKKSRISKK